MSSIQTGTGMKRTVLILESRREQSHYCTLAVPLKMRKRWVRNRRLTQVLAPQKHDLRKHPARDMDVDW